MTLKDFYEDRTRAGQLWGYSTDVSGIVTGDVEGYALTWIRDANGNLYAQGPRMYDVRRRVALPVVVGVVRLLDADFVVDALRDARVNYTVELTVEQTVLGLTTTFAKVDLQINGVSTSAVENLLEAALTLGSSMKQTHQKVLAAYVPAGATVRLVSTTQSNGTATLLSWQETLI